MGRRKNSLLLGVLSLFMSLVLVVGLVPTLALAEIVDEAAEGNQTAAADEGEATQNDAQRGQEVPENAGTVSGGVASTDVMPTNATADGVPRDSDPASGEDGADPTGATTDSTHRDQDQTGDKDGTEPAETAVDSTQHSQDSSEAKTGDDARKGEDQQKEKPDSAQAKERSSYPAFAPQTVEVDGVKIGVRASEGAFPADAKLSVTSVAASEQERADEAVDDVRAAEKNVAASRTFDIKVLAADGTTELEPAGDAKVEVSFSLAEATDKNLDTTVYHVTEDENANKLAAEALPILKESGETITTVTDGFSLYTVEFTYNRLEYVLQGDSAVALGEILRAVGLTGDVTNVEVSDASLFSASSETSEWIVTAHQAFSTTEWMKVTIGGIAYEIVVTDSQDTLSAAGSVGAMATVTYVERSWNGSEVVSTTSTHDATPVPSNGNMTSGWYYLNSNVTKDGRVESINGDVHLILGDGYKLDVKGLYVPSGSTLYVYGQANGTGRIYSHPSGGAAIGGYSEHDNGNIEIHGGTIEAKGYNNCAGIGSNDGRTTGTITIYGGTITATGGKNGAGIGAGKESNGGTIQIYGGTITATGGDYSAGIGAGRDSDGGTIQIYGGNITATGKDSSAGIGGGDASGSRADFSTIEIYGGDIYATGNSQGAGIGGGEFGSANITISGGTIHDAKGGSSGGAGIGSGRDGAGSTITITGGTISATSRSGGAGIGSGLDGAGSTITITNGNISSVSSSGYGIGNGKNKKGTNSTITLGSAETDQGFKVQTASFNGAVVLDRALWNDNGAYAVGTMSDSQKTRMAGSPVRLLSFDEVDSWEKLQCAIDSAGSNDTIELSGDVIASSVGSPSQQVKKGKTITIDLNGHKIDRGLYKGASRSDGSVIVNNGTLTIKDSVGSGVIRGGNYYKEDDNNGGGGIRNFGTLTIEGGTISDNLSLRKGGGIYVATGATLNLYGGRITCNASDERFGSGIYVSNEVTKGATLNVRGNPVVAGNTVRDSTTPSNVHLAGIAVINVTGDLDNSASIGVGKPNGYEPVITSGLSGHGGPGNFVSDKDDYAVRTNASNEAQLKKLYTVGIDANIENGGVTADPQMACQGDTVTLTVEPSDPYYYEVDQVSYFDGAIDYVVQNNNGYSFTMPASSVRVSATFKKVAHTVTIAQMTNGTVAADKQTAVEGDTVTLTPHAREWLPAG